MILNRGWGKPIQAVQVDGRLMDKKLHDMTDAELVMFEERLMASVADRRGCRSLIYSPIRSPDQKPN